MKKTQKLFAAKIVISIFSVGFLFSCDGGSGATQIAQNGSVLNQTSTQTPTSAPTTAPTTGPTRGTSTTGWELTVYYTAVESYHTGASTTVSGCLDLACTGKGTIGSYPSDFLQKVENEGTGRITSGTHAGNYLNWSYDVGYWLDSAPRDSYGGTLIPFVSSAADTNVLALGTQFQVSQCGTGASASFCSQVMAAKWQVKDQFTPGLGGSKHLDLYIGEEDEANFENTSAKYTTLEGATVLEDSAQ